MRSREFNGERCREVREKRKLTLQELADLISDILGYPVTVSSVSKWELGHRSPNPKRFGALCQALQVTEAFLLVDREVAA